ncbi:MAG TPA: hypothetical protein VF487_02455 [Chitinophagaceae bacterium]
MLFFLGSFFVTNLSAQCPAGACTAPGTIVIDGNPCDWSSTNFATFAIKSYQLDKFGNGVVDSQFTQGSKDFFEAEDLRWSVSQTKAKNDIANGAAVLVGTNLYFAGDRTSNNGDAQIGFWFYLNGTGPHTRADGTQDFAPNHAIGDLLVLADFTGGGKNAAVTILKWVGTGGNVSNTNGTLNTTDCQGIVAQNNDASFPIPAGWSFINSCYDQNEFYEGRVDLSCVLGPGANLCFSSFLLETRSSQSITASLDDFVSGAFNAKPLPPTIPPMARCGAGSITLTATCTGSTVRWYTASSGGSPLVTGGIYTVSGSTLTINPLAATTTFYASCYNASVNCESDRTPVVATINANPTANAGPDEAKCQTPPSGPTSFTLAGTATNGTTAWSQIGSTGTASASITTPSSLTSTVSVSGIGTVTLRLTTTSNATPSCGSVTDDVILTVNANPTANAGPDQAKCQTAPSGPTSFTLAGTAANGTTAWTQIGSTGTASASITTPSSLTSAVSVSGIGTVTLRLTTTSNASPSCGTATDDVILTVNANPTANAGPDQAKCQTAPSGPTSFTLAGTAANGTTAWTQIGSTGTASASITTPGSLTSNVDVSGIGTVTLRLTTTSNATPSCGTATDDVILTVNANPTANAGPDETKCQTAPSGPTSFTLAGTAANGTTAWSQIGSTGTASASITTPGSLTSTVSVSGIGTVTLRLTTTSNATPSCGTATDDVILTVNANPTANAGPDQTKCQTPPSGPTSFTLAGTAANGTTAWTQIGSTGTASASITTPGSLTSTVSVSGIGTVTLRLTTTSNTTPACGTATDDVVLAVNTNPTANAGPDQAKCQVFPAGPTPFTLAGTATNGTTLWSQIASTGTASASITTPTSLTSGVSVSGAGTVTLRLTTTSNATPSCGTATDDVILTVNALPLIRTLVPANFCPSDPFVGGSLTLQNAQAGVSYQLQLDNVNTQAPKVAANEGDNLTWTGLAAGNYTVEATVIATSCNTESGPATVNENTSPVAGAGPDQAKCQTAPSGPTSFTLAGTAANGTPAWTQVGSTGTASASITTPSSLTSAVSVSGIGTVTLRLTVTSNATPPCGTATDDVILTVNANPTANAGPDQTKCQTAPSGPTSFTLAGSAANGTTAWSQIGSTGTASASITTPGSLTSNVNVSGIGTVTLRLTTTSNATPSCGTATDDVILTVNANPTANAGPDETKCQTAPSGPTSFTLAGTAANGTTAWSQIGSTGTANASITTPGSLTSTVSVSGIGTVTLRLTTTSNATPSCGTATDDVVLTVNANPTANAGPDQAKCQTAPSGPTSFTLAGSAANGTTAWSQVGSTGTANASITTPGSLTSTVSVSGVGTVTLRLTTTSNATPSCGTATDDVILTVNPNPTCSIVGDDEICQGSETSSFTASGGDAGATYSWTGPAGFVPTTGATISNLTLAGTYTVTITNATGSCTSTCSKTLTVKDCGGHIFPTQTTCCNYITGTSFQLLTACYTPSAASNGSVSNAIPGVFFYYSKVVAPAANFTLDVTQFNDGKLDKLFQVHQFDKLSQIRLFTEGCGTNVTFIPSTYNDGTQVRYMVTGATPGATYIISIKYNTKSIIGATYSGPAPISTYTFEAKTKVGLDPFMPVAGSIGNIDATPGCADNTPLPGDCTLPATILVQTNNVALPGFAPSIQEAATDLTVRAFPNPFTDKVNFVITSPVSGQAVLEVTNLLGQRVQIVYKGFLFAGRNQVVEYKAPAVSNSSLIYTLRVGDQKATGKLLRIK